VPVALLGFDPDGWGAVAGRVRDEVRDDSVEYERVDNSSQVVRDSQLDLVGRRQRAFDDIRQNGLQHDRPRLDCDGARVESRQVEQLLEQPAEPLALLDPDAKQLLLQFVRQRAAAAGQGLEHPVDGSRGRPELVRGDGDEVELELIELDELFV